MPGALVCHRFEVQGAPLGSGSTGVVWPAVDRATGRAVAVKVLHPERVGDPETLARLQDEVAVAGRLSHPNVVGVLGLWADGPGRWVLVTERASGEPLHQVVTGPLAPAAVAALGFELASALEAAHGAGLVHGDVRPGNVLVGAGGARLFDFGTGRIVHAGQTAPEVIDGAPPGPASDLYGLGVVLHLALTGQMPFAGDGPAERLAAQRRGPPAVAGPRGLASLVKLLLHPDPTRRPSDLASVRAALGRLRADPRRRLRLRRPMAPFRPGREWVVHGIDPATGARALVAAGLSRSAARELLANLRGHGWSVAAHPEAVGWRDALIVLLLAGALGVALPVVGLPLGAWLGWSWASARTFPSLRRALPAVTTPVPPRVLPTGNETAVMAGVLLLAAGVLLALQSWAALLPIALLVALAVWSSRARRAVDPAVVAEEAHLRAAVAEARLLVDGRPRGLDDALAVTGEIGALEAVWRERPEDRRDVGARLEAIGHGLRSSSVAPPRARAEAGPERERAGD